MGWTRRDPSRYGFGLASWRLDMVNEMIRRETGRHARLRTLQRILRRLDLSYSKPRVTLIENFASHAVVQEFIDVKLIEHVLKYSDTACVRSSSVS